MISLAIKTAPNTYVAIVQPHDGMLFTADYVTKDCVSGEHIGSFVSLDEAIQAVCGDEQHYPMCGICNYQLLPEDFAALDKHPSPDLGIVT